MGLYDYTEFNWPKGFTLVIPVGTFTEAVPVYAFGNAGAGYTPPTGRIFKAKRLEFHGTLSAAGTGVIIQTRAFKSTISAPNVCLSCDTVATDDPGDIDATTTTPGQTSTGKDIFTDADKLMIRTAMLTPGGGDTCTGTGVVIFEGEWQ